MVTKKRTAAFESGRDPLTFADMTQAEQSLAVGAVNNVSMKAKVLVKGVADQLETRTNLSQPEKQRSQRALNALPAVRNKPFTVQGAVDSRIKYMTSAAKGVLKDGEGIGGEGFYFDHMREINKVRENSDIPLAQVLDATSKLSVRTKPEAEKAATKALLQAHGSGLVNMTPDVVLALHSLKNKRGQQLVTVPKEQQGRIVPFRELNPEAASQLTHPDIRETIRPHTNADLDNLSKTAIRANVANAHKVLQGNPSNPQTNPKTVSYARAHEMAVPDGDIEYEYRDRARKVGEALRSGSYQESHDLFGLQDSNEGALSARALTPADMHENRMSFNQPGKAYKVSSDALRVTTKKVTKRGGGTAMLGAGDKRITPIGIEHSVHQEAVHQTATQLRAMMGLRSTVPAMLVQETGWAGTRRANNEDAEYNSRVNALPKEPKVPRSNSPEHNIGTQFKKRKPVDFARTKVDGQLF